MNILDPIFENIGSVFCVKNTLMRIRIRDLVNPGSGIEKNGIRDKHPGSAILKKKLKILQKIMHRATSCVLVM